MVNLLHRIATLADLVLGPRPAAGWRSFPTAAARAKPAPMVVLSRAEAPQAISPPSRPTWMADPAYLDLARQLLKALGSRQGGRNRVAATMGRALWQTRDPGMELQRLCEESKTVLRALGELRLEQVRQAWQAKADAEAKAQDADLEPLRAIAARSR